jgi:hypothetical protein
VSVGRFTNLAEVGYFADRFSSWQIPSRTRQHDEFRALDGAWQSVYILQVPDEQAPRAVELIRAELAGEDTAPETARWPDSHPKSPVGPSSTGLAKSVVLVIVVGGLAYFAGQAGRPGQPTGAPTGPPLWQTLVEIDGTLTSDPRAATAYQVDANRNSETVVIRRDTDGDGRFERWREYKRGQLVRD